LIELQARTEFAVVVAAIGHGKLAVADTVLAEHTATDHAVYHVSHTLDVHKFKMIEHDLCVVFECSPVHCHTVILFMVSPQ